jgi:hypothetical protein
MGRYVGQDNVNYSRESVKIMHPEPDQSAQDEKSDDNNKPAPAAPFLPKIVASGAPLTHDDLAEVVS